jgi:hypothetical protein
VIVLHTGATMHIRNKEISYDHTRAHFEGQLNARTVLCLRFLFPSELVSQYNPFWAGAMCRQGGGVFCIALSGDCNTITMQPDLHSV